VLVGAFGQARPVPAESDAVQVSLVPGPVLPVPSQDAVGLGEHHGVGPPGAPAPVRHGDFGRVDTVLNVNPAVLGERPFLARAGPVGEDCPSAASINGLVRAQESSTRIRAAVAPASPVFANAPVRPGGTAIYTLGFGVLGC